MILVEAGDTYRLEWLDEEKTILRMDIQPGSKWDDAYVAIPALDRAIQSVEHDVYSIYQFQPGAGNLPKFSAPNIKKLLGSVVQNEKLIILVGVDVYFNNILNLLQRIYGYLQANASKIHIIHNFDEALELIEADKELAAHERE